MSKRICSKKFFVICFVFCFVSLLFAQTKEDIISRIPNAESLQPWELSEVMPDWSEYFSIDEDFDVTDLAKIRWVDYGEGNYEWREYETISFNFYIPPCYKWYKRAYLHRADSQNGEAYSYTATSFSLIAELEPECFIEGFSSARNVSLFYEKKNNGTFTNNSMWLNNFLHSDGSPVVFSDISGTYVPSQDSISNGNTTIDEKLFISSIIQNDYLGIIKISDNNEGLQPGGCHLFSYNAEKHEIKGDGGLISFYDDGRFIGTDDFTIKILSYNDKIKLLLLETPRYTRPFVPLEDYFVPEADCIYFKKTKYALLEKPDFNSETKFTGSNTDKCLILYSTPNYEESNGVLSKWYYVKSLGTNEEGWIFGTEIENPTYLFRPDSIINSRFSQYNTSKLINKPATFNDTRVRCRTQPNLDCDTQGFYNLGDKVTVLYKSLDPTEIDGESWYWYLVRSDSLPDGWVYGKYLDIEE